MGGRPGEKCGSETETEAESRDEDREDRVVSGGRVDAVWSEKWDAEEHKPAGPGGTQLCETRVPTALAHGEIAKTGRKWQPEGIPSVVRPAGTIQAVPMAMPRHARSWQVSVDMARKIGIVCGTAPAIAAVCQGTFRLLPFFPPHE